MRSLRRLSHHPFLLKQVLWYISATWLSIDGSQRGREQGDSKLSRSINKDLSRYTAARERRILVLRILVDADVNTNPSTLGADILLNIMLSSRVLQLAQISLQQGMSGFVPLLLAHCPCHRTALTSTPLLLLYRSCYYTTFTSILLLL